MSRPHVLDLPGSCNLRDFGGYVAADGRRVRRGRLFRSGLLRGLAQPGLDALRALNVRAVCDLRRSEERRLQPNPEFGPGCRVFEWETSAESSPIRDPAFLGSASLEAARAEMVRMYERLPFVLKPRLAGAFHAITHAGDGATIIHCTAGKDRTGVAVALILDTLGVPRETIVADYLYTNEAVDLAARLLGPGAHGAGFAATDEPIRALRDHARTAVLEAHPTYLVATFAAVESRHGSIGRYLREELQLEPELLEELRRRLLE